MKSIKELWQKSKDNGFDGISLILLICIFIILGGYVATNKSLNRELHDSQNQRIANHIQKQTVSVITSDRVIRHRNRLPVTKKTQRIARTEARLAYQKLPKQHQSYFDNHLLHTNTYLDHSVHAKHLIKSAHHAPSVRYQSNIAELSFGKRKFSNATQKNWSWHHVKDIYGLVRLINHHLMQPYLYSKKNKRKYINPHTNKILNKNNKSMGVSVIYNHQLNQGILTETFKSKK